MRVCLFVCLCKYVRQHEGKGHVCGRVYVCYMCDDVKSGRLCEDEWAHSGHGLGCA